MGVASTASSAAAMSLKPLSATASMSAWRLVEGRVEHRLGDAEFPGEAAHRDGGPAVGLGETAGGADDLIASQVEIRSGSR